MRVRGALAALAVLTAAALAVVVLTPDRFKTAGFDTPGSESSRSSALLDRAFGYDPQAGMAILARSPTGFDSLLARARLTRLAARAASDPAVGYVQSPFAGPPLPALLSRDRRSALVLVHFRTTNIDTLSTPIARLRRNLRSPPLELAFGGYDVAFLEAGRSVRSDLVRAELLAFPLLAALALLIFRGLVASLIALSGGAVAVLLTFACLRLLAGLTAISIFALDLALLLGLGLAVDYGLLLITRYREEAAADGFGRPALRRTIATAGRAVAFSGCAIAAASAALLLFPQSFISSMGLAGVLVALLAAASSLTLTPPLLLLAGSRIGLRHGRRAEGAPSVWQRLPRWVMRRPVDVALIGILLLIAAAAPALRLTPTFTDQSAIPKGYESRSVADAVQREFAPNLFDPVNVAVRLGAPRSVQPGLLAASLARAPGVELVAPTQRTASVGLVQAVLRQPPYAAASQALIAGIRRLHRPLLVGGNTAQFVDLKSSIDSRGPPAVALVAVVTLLVLFGLSGSVVLAVKALLLDLLGLLAALGVLVLIFQEHALGLSALVAYHGPKAIEITSVVVILASAYGLTTDYSILLLSRIVEEHEAGRPDERAVSLGIERSGPVISNAALLLVAALLALASTRVFLVKQLTVGQVLAVIIDVSIIRLLLVPAIMRILGRANWWAPVALRRRRARRLAPARRL